jgi:hypothetical protein
MSTDTDVSICGFMLIATFLHTLSHYIQASVRAELHVATLHKIRGKMSSNLYYQQYV